MVRQLDVEALLDELTLMEKVSLLAGENNWATVPIPRLDIPAVTLSDGPNGVRGIKFFNSIPSNCFTCGTGMAATFNKDLLKEAGELMADEAKCKNVHCILGPTTCIARSPLGGRNFESYSEDPVLSGFATASVVKGIQSKDVMSCVKHFVGNEQEHERKGVDSIITERALREIYLKPFQMAVRDAKPKAFMTAYNRVNGTHVSQNKQILQEILRKEWGFDGLIMSDWFGVYSTKEAIDAGLNLEMPGPTRFRRPLQVAHKVVNHEIHINEINDNVRHVLNFINNSFKAGIDESKEPGPNESEEASRLLRKLGDESIVLLKNDNNILPLLAKASKGNEKIAVIGPNAKVAQDSGGGSASMSARYKVTPWDGIYEKVKAAGADAVKLEYSLGAYLDNITPDLGTVLRTKDGQLGITGRFYAEDSSVKGRKTFDELLINTTRIFLADYDHPGKKSGNALFYAEFEGYFTPEVSGTYKFGTSCLGTSTLYVDDKLIVDNATKQVKGADFFLGMGTREETGTIELEAGKTYKVLVDFGSGPTSKLGTEYAEIGGVFFGAQLEVESESALKEAVEVAKQVDKVILVVGISKEFESEGFDRPDMDIPGYTNRLIAEVAKVNSNVIVVNQSGSPVTMPWINDISALVQAWYGGNELGNTIADVLFGDYNPSGKLSMTFPVALEDNPSYLNFGSTHGRVLYGEDVFVGYRFYEKVNTKPLFPFGFGLSYTTFEFSNLKVSVDGDDLTVTVDVTNTGKIAGGEAVQVYVAPTKPSIIRPNKELKDFAKVFVDAGKTKSVKIVTSVKEATSYWDSYHHKWLSEKDTYKVLVGNSSDNILQESLFATDKTYRWIGA